MRTACADPAGTVQTLLEENPVWSRVDALNAVKNRQMLDVVRVAQLLRTSRWDLQALVRRLSRAGAATRRNTGHGHPQSPIGRP